MNFKRNLLTIIALLGSVGAVSACSFKKGFSEYQPIAITPDETEDVVGEGYVKHAKYSTYEAYNKDGDKVDLGTAHDVTYTYVGKKVLKSVGERKIVVIPVDFEDFNAFTLNIKPEDYIANVRTAFFGTSKINKYVSVAEFYNRSSYGKLRITGHVCDKFYTFNKKVADINKDKSKDTLVRENISLIEEWYKNTYMTSLNLAGNEDTALYLVYTLPTELNTQNPTFFWAYTFPDIRVSWSSYSTMNTVSGSPDAHTFIHEVGHLFGLNDYYPTKEADQKPVEPTGRIDMMDCSIGDHTALSKMYLDWAKPYHVNGNSEIKIKPLVESGDLILINDHWNGNVFDEYYLIEFYVPLGLNYFDSVNGNNMAKLPTLPGIKIYHVDARLGYFDKSTPGSSPFYCYADELQEEGKGVDPDKNKHNIDFAHDNSTKTVEPEVDEGGEEGGGEEIIVPTVPTKYLYELKLNHVESGSATGCASNVNLYRPGDVFQGEDFVFNKDNDTNYKITIPSMTFKEATIKIERI